MYNGGIIGKSRLYFRPPSGVFSIKEVLLQPDLRGHLISDLTSVSAITHDDGLVAVSETPALFGGNSITWSKTATTRTWCTIKDLWPISAVNMTHRKLYFPLYLTSTALSTINGFRISIGKDSSNKSTWAWANPGVLVEGWNELVVDCDSPNSTTGTTYITSVTFLEVYFTVASNSTILGLNNIFVDAFFYM